MWSPNLVSAAVLFMRAVLVVTKRSDTCNVTQVYHLNTLHQMQQFGIHDDSGTCDVTCSRTLKELSTLQGEVRNMSERQLQILQQATQTDCNVTLESLQTAYHSIAADLKKISGAMNDQFVLLSQRLDAIENRTSSALDIEKIASGLNKLSATINNQIKQLSQQLDAMENATSSALGTEKTTSGLNKLFGAINNQFVLLSQRLDAMENATSSVLDIEKIASALNKMSGAMNHQFVQFSQRLDDVGNATSFLLESGKSASDMTLLINTQFAQLSQRLDVMENSSSFSAKSLFLVYDRLKFLMDTQNRTEESVAIIKNALDTSQSHPTDCEEAFLKGYHMSGVYLIWPQGSSRPIPVYCEMGAKKWTVIMRRLDGSVSFEVTWDRYKWGFGIASGEYWLGLEYMHLLTKQRPMQLRFDMTEWETGSNYHAVFHPFTIDDSSLNYRIHVERRSGTAESGRLTHANEKPFTAKDRDNDSSSGNCAVKERGGWWHGDCSNALPTGPYRRSCSDDICMTWRYEVALRYVTMKLARV